MEKSEKKVFEPYEHVLFTRYDILKDKSGKGRVVVPDGYEILQINPIITCVGNSCSSSPRFSVTGVYDIWYTNNKTVEAEMVFNETIEKYDFYDFGKVKKIEPGFTEGWRTVKPKKLFLKK